jgi:eukaryotic-like serine/threonine-protein kinase
MTELEVFLKAIEINDPAERSAFLDNYGDVSIRQRVEALINSHGGAGGFTQPSNLAAALDQAGSNSSRSRSEEKPGSIIAGRYKLLEPIGEGGMGAVWMADQLEPVKRRVAVKLIRTERDGSSMILSRFEAERQAIALMDHPNIAKLLDAGTTGDAPRPFFVMELVKGVPLTDFCDEHRLSIPDRLHLFVQICSAVQHAHQKGIIHRDLKPSNILVEMHGDKPAPKVIDFGLAKAMSGQPLTERTLFTGFGTVAGTPLYMAPEQAKFSAVDVDTRADVYALGVILYELLTGSTPIERATLKQAALDEMLRTIRESDPPTPSKRLSSTDAAPSVAANRQTEPLKLGRIVKGDLDWIVMKALAKERNRRYETANEFARDVERFLNDEPVAVGPPSAAYKLRKFVQRNRTQVVAASLVLLALLAGFAGTAFGLVRAEANRLAAVAAAEREAGERKKAEAATSSALANEAAANAVIKFFEDKVFAAANPKGQDGGLGHEVTLREAVDASLPALATDFADKPLVEARLRSALGQTFFYLGQYARAVEQYERAHALLLNHRGAEHTETLMALSALANNYARVNRHAEALKIRQEVVEARKRSLPRDHPDTLASIHSLSNSLVVVNRHDEALKLREQVLAARQRTLSPDHAETLSSMINLARSYTAMNRRQEATKLYEQTLAAQKRTLPVDHPDVLMSVNNLAASYAGLNRQAEALKLREETLSALKKVLPPDHPNLLGSMHNLANSYAALNRHAEALKLREKTLAARRRTLPHDHPDVLMSMNNLANSYAIMNRHPGAVKLFEETLAAQKRVLPPDHPNTLMSLHNLARSYTAVNRHADALPLIDEFLAKVNRPGVNPRSVPSAVSVRFQCCRALGDVAGCRKTAELWENRSPSDDEGLYSAACYRAVTASLQAGGRSNQDLRVAKEDADKAMTWLTKAVAAGWKDSNRIKKDSDLDYLSDREDFKKLLGELNAKSAQTKSRAKRNPRRTNDIEGFRVHVAAGRYRSLWSGTSKTLQ